MRGLKRLINGLFCSVLVLGLASNSGVSSSHAEENVVTSDPSNLSESLESDNQSEQSSEASGSTENEENIVSDEKSSEMIDQISDQNNENNDISEKKSSDLTEQSSVSSKKRASKAVLATTKNQATTEDGQVLDIAHTKFELSPDNKSITLTEYTGNKTDLVIPSKIKYRGMDLAVKIKLNLGNANLLFPKNVHSIKFVSVEGTKVSLENNTADGVSLDHLFAVNKQTYPNLTSIDFSGLDMDNVVSMYATFDGNFLPNLTTLNFGNNTLPNVTTMEIAFNQFKSLQKIDQHWTFGKLKTMKQMFWAKDDNSSQLTSIGDTAGWDTSTVTNMQGMFLNCTKLENLDLSRWDTSNVTNMSNMFWNCQRLSSIGDTSNWNVSKVTNFSGMFYNCASLSEIRMDNWDFQQLANIGGTDVENPNDDNSPMFYLYSRGYEPLPALIVTSNKQLIDYPYAKAGYKPICGIRINTNTGKLPDHLYWDRKNDKNTDISYYFYQTAIPTTQYNELSKLSGQDLQNKVRNWLEDNIPTKSDYALTGWAPTDEDFEKKIQSITDFKAFMNSTEEFTANWVSDKFDTSPDNSKLNPTGSLGLAYYPTTFKINSVDLHSSGEQKIPISKQVSLNLGVKDRTRTRDTWTVTAQLTWSGNRLPNAYITSDNSTVTENTSTGSGAYSPSTDLKALSNNGITGISNYQINSNPNPIMKSNGTMVNNGVYDFNLGEAVLVIRDVSQVRAGTYSGQVEWNLINGPA
ncbi:BspA family leucine-rich repeat surface protein [Enterococcus hirae]|nr:BspA family leucine-rich repeat surface protein [Enterococcus hirae]